MNNIYHHNNYIKVNLNKHFGEKRFLYFFLFSLKQFKTLVFARRNFLKDSSQAFQKTNSHIEPISPHNKLWIETWNIFHDQIELKICTDVGCRTQTPNVIKVLRQRAKIIFVLSQILRIFFKRVVQLLAIKYLLASSCSRS